MWWSKHLRWWKLLENNILLFLSLRKFSVHPSKSLLVGSNLTFLQLFHFPPHKCLIVNHPINITLEPCYEYFLNYLFVLVHSFFVLHVYLLPSVLDVDLHLFLISSRFVLWGNKAIICSVLVFFPLKLFTVKAPSQINIIQGL